MKQTFIMTVGQGTSPGVDRYGADSSVFGDITPDRDYADATLNDVVCNIAIDPAEDEDNCQVLLGSLGATTEFAIRSVLFEFPDGRVVVMDDKLEGFQRIFFAGVLLSMIWNNTPRSFRLFQDYIGQDVAVVLSDEYQVLPPADVNAMVNVEPLSFPLSE